MRKNVIDIDHGSDKAVVYRIL